MIFLLFILLSSEIKHLSGIVNIHIIPHSHNDVGWLKTPEEYYYGLKNEVQNTEVRLIFDSVTMALTKNSQRTFTYDTIAYFSMWYESLNNETKIIFENLLKNGQFEFVNGGWVSNDEATTDYMNIIDQFTDGLLYLKRVFDGEYRPSVAWQVDSFGHSSGQASIYSAMEFKALFVGRVSAETKRELERSKKQEMNWYSENTASYRDTASIFLSILPDNYTAPEGLCFDVLCKFVNVVDLPGYENYQQYVNKIINYAKATSRKYKTNNIILTMGGDFAYQVADTWYDNIDVIIKYVNKVSGYHAFYSTPLRYYKSIIEYGVLLPQRTGDFLPYVSSEHACWTGFYSSRPGFKRLVRETTEILRACKQLVSFDRNLDQTETETLKHVLDTAQHHDAITGTAKQRVNDHYTSQLHEASAGCQSVFNKFLANKFKIANSLVFCDHMHMGLCEFIRRNNEFIIVLYNQNSIELNTTISIPILGQAYSVYDQQNELVSSFVSPKLAIEQHDSNYHTLPNVIQFMAHMKPLGFTAYWLTPAKQVEVANSHYAHHKIHIEMQDIFHYDNSYYSAIFDLNLGTFQSLGLKTKDGIKYVMLQYEHLLYESNTGDSRSHQSSGAYIFRPASNTPSSCDDKAVFKPCTVHKSSDASFAKIVCYYSSSCRQEIHFDKDSRTIRLHYAIGPLAEDRGTEMVIRFKTNIGSNNLFYTDINGRSTIQRRLNGGYQEAVACEYVPVVKKIFINDTSVQLNVFTDRSLGGASLSPGSIELMLNRRMFNDDHLGVNEALDERDKVSGQGLVSIGDLWIMLSLPIRDDNLVTTTAYALQRPPIISFSNKRQIRNHFPWNFNNLSLPPQIRLLSFERYNNSQKFMFLIRFENIYSSLLSENVETSFDMIKFLHPIQVACVREQVLSGDIRIERGGKNNVNCCGCGKSLVVYIQPQHIRTFLITVRE